MPNQNVFCNSPWYELNIYWDGSLGFCCQAAHKPYVESESYHYNVKTMSINQWVDSAPMRQARLSMFGDTKNSSCANCQLEEKFGGTSRRHKSNQKSVIFTRSGFDQSYVQSPGYKWFEKSRTQAGTYNRLPIDLHIDLGNYCNLACKMCSPRASSRIAAHQIRWGIKDAEKFLNTDWTKDEHTWRKVLSELASIENLRNVHFMGGETLISNRFEEFVDFMIQQARVDLSLSLVTNGTIFKPTLMQKLAYFQQVNIEVSIESLDATNVYQRQGTDQNRVMSNLNKYLSWSNGHNFTLTLRPAISALTISSYHTLLTYAHQNQLIVKALLVTTPQYLDVRVLPQSVRIGYLKYYDKLQEDLVLEVDDSNLDFNESDPNQFRRVILNQVQLCQRLLQAPNLDDADTLQAEMIFWCKRWDEIYGYDARSIYPEWIPMLDKHGY